MIFSLSGIKIQGDPAKSCHLHVISASYCCLLMNICCNMSLSWGASTIFDSVRSYNSDCRCTSPASQPVLNANFCLIISVPNLNLIIAHPWWHVIAHCAIIWYNTVCGTFSEIRHEKAFKIYLWLSNIHVCWNHLSGMTIRIASRVDSFFCMDVVSWETSWWDFSSSDHFSRACSLHKTNLATK